MRGNVARAGERGASAVEFALLLPLLLLLIAGVIDFGRAFMTQAAITAGAREGVRMLALGHPVNAAESRATLGAQGFQISSSNTLSFPSPVTCSPTPLPTDAASLTVEVTFHYLILDGVSAIFGGAIPSTSTFRATGSMRCVG